MDEGIWWGGEGVAAATVVEACVTGGDAGAEPGADSDFDPMDLADATAAVDCCLVPVFFSLKA